MDPFQLYEEQGISSYNLGVMSQPMIGTYYWFKEALKTQNIKLAVIEIKSAGRSSEKAEEKARKSYDYMKWGKNKIQYALDYKDFHKEADGTDEEVDLWSYLFPLSLYHTRWSELSYDDYDFFLGKNNSNTKGFSVLSTQFKKIQQVLTLKKKQKESMMDLKLSLMIRKHQILLMKNMLLSLLRRQNNRVWNYYL